MKKRQYTVDDDYLHRVYVDGYNHGHRDGSKSGLTLGVKITLTSVGLVLMFVTFLAVVVLS